MIPTLYKPTDKEWKIIFVSLILLMVAVFGTGAYLILSCGC